MRKPIIIAMTTNKGGTGKTTVTLGLGAALARMDYKVLLIDLDSQGNTSQGVGLPAPLHNVGELLLEMNTWEQTLIIGRDTNIDLLPANAKMVTNGKNLENVLYGQHLLGDVLKAKAYHYDFILIDCPPNLGIYTLMALTAATHYLVPTQASAFGFEGLKGIREFIASVRHSRGNPSLLMAGVLRVNFKERTVFGKNMLESLFSSTDLRVFDTVIREDATINESQFLGQSVFTYRPKSKAAADFSALATEIIANLKDEA